MSSKTLGRGSPLGGSGEGKLFIALVIVCVILAAVAFALFAANQSQDKSLKDRVAELEAIEGNMSQATQDLAMLRANYSSLSGQLATVKANYEDVSSRYHALQNKSDTDITRMNTFLEDTPTIAYTYVIASKLLADNKTNQVVTVTAYNLGKTDVDGIKMTCTVKTGNTTSVQEQTFPSVMSMDKRAYSWEFSNNTIIEDVWAGLA
ncbi:MAG: hypothetical protein WBZ29_08915 [Methanocella sp.]